LSADVLPKTVSSCPFLNVKLSWARIENGLKRKVIIRYLYRFIVFIFS
jgi:hypothetical protein